VGDAIVIALNSARASLGVPGVFGRLECLTANVSMSPSLTPCRAADGAAAAYYRGPADCGGSINRQSSSKAPTRAPVVRRCARHAEVIEVAMRQQIYLISPGATPTLLDAVDDMVDKWPLAPYRSGLRHRGS